MVTPLRTPDIPLGATEWGDEVVADLVDIRNVADTAAAQAAATVGRLLLLPRGAWSAATTYAPGDMVTYQGSAWYALLASTNVLPTNPVSWGNLAKGGA